jgi:hypothetical protein
MDPPAVIASNADLRSNLPSEVDYSSRHIMYQVSVSSILSSHHLNGFDKNLVSMLFEEMANKSEENLRYVLSSDKIVGSPSL